MPQALTEPQAQRLALRRELWVRGGVGEKLVVCPRVVRRDYCVCGMCVCVGGFVCVCYVVR